MSVTISGSGQIVKQVVSTALTSTFTTSSAIPTFVDVTGVSATITPTNASNKILVTITGVMGIANANYTWATNLVRGSTSIAIGDARGSTTRCFEGGSLGGTGDAKTFTICYLDSPATTSATTYKLQAAAESGTSVLVGGTWRSDLAQSFSCPTVITLQEIAYA